ncbi:hypothetical protein CLOM_g11243 [Closterium sp. NIES-68]|nr:hypothetical protein CLOM_g11243 [Closterium sp. NIES-68]GJP60450.1 hypothetical protein CLOP_g17669 [Closterium sp. NIES-67]
MDSAGDPSWKRSVFDLSHFTSTPSLLLPAAVDLHASPPNPSTTFTSPSDVFSVHAMGPSWRHHDASATSAPGLDPYYDFLSSSGPKKQIQRKSSGGPSSSSDPLRRPSRQNSYQRRLTDSPLPADYRVSSSSSSSSFSSSISDGQNRGGQQQRHRPGMSFQSNPVRLQGDPVEAHLAHAVSELAATRAPPAEELLGFSEQDIQDSHQIDGRSGTRKELIAGTPPAARMMSRRAILVVTVFLFLLIVLPALLPSISPPPSALLVIPVMLMFMLVYLALAPHHLPGRNHVYT